MTVSEAMQARVDALRELRQWWASEGPLACGPCADQENLFAAVREFMDADRAVRESVAAENAADARERLP